ncbi:MAG: OmpA family protein [Gammaproteobacteria bacterium]|nr:OmpA family protein [Gammaproteobacteria bacterium]
MSYGWIGLVVGFCWSTTLSAAPPAFAQSAEEIIEALTASPSSETSLNLGQPRTLFGEEGPRALRRKQEVEAMTEDGWGEQSTIHYESAAELGRANLMIQFQFNSADLSPESVPLLQELGSALGDERLQQKRLVIAGHTDALGEDSYNMDLSLRRAKSVRNYLLEHAAIDQSRLRIIGFGERLPLLDNSSPGNRAKNRRVEVIRVE